VKLYENAYRNESGVNTPTFNICMHGPFEKKNICMHEFALLLRPLILVLANKNIER
jgi:hypothetical protein